MTPDVLAQRLHPLMEQELTAIAGLEQVLTGSGSTDYSILFKDMRAGHGVSARQISAVVRGSRTGTRIAGALAGRGGRVHRLVVEIAGIEGTLRILRWREQQLIADYRDNLTWVSGPLRAALEMAADQARRYWHILTAHLARQTRFPEEAMSLPHPLDLYFVSDADRVCSRCFLDRPGRESALSRANPPIYLCAACRVEVESGMGPTFQARWRRYPAHLRENRILERALSRPSLELAKLGVLAVLSGLAPTMPSREGGLPPSRQLGRQLRGSWRGKSAS